MIDDHFESHKAHAWILTSAAAKASSGINNPMEVLLFGKALHEMIDVSLAADLAPQAEDVGGRNLGVEADEIAAAGPDVAVVGEQVVHLVGISGHPAEFLEWDVDECVLCVPHVEVHDDEDDVIPRGGHLDVVEDEVVVGLAEAEVAKFVQGAVVTTDRVQSRDPWLDVPGRVPVAFLELIFF